MADFVWPADLVPYAVTYYLQPHSGGSESPFSRQTKVYGLSAPRWVCRMSFRGGYNYDWKGGPAAEYGPRLDAMIAKLRGRQNRVAIADFRRKPTAGTLTNAAIDAGDSSVVLTGAIAPKVGEYLTGDGRPHLITGVSGSGPYTVSVEPPFGAAVDAGTEAYQISYGIFRLTSDDAGVNPSEVGSPTSYDLEFVEDIGGAAFAGGTPVIAGSPVIGGMLSVAGDFTSYQWLADGVPIEGAAGSTFTLTADEAGKMISVTVGLMLGGTATSAAVGPVVAPTVLIVAIGNSLTSGPNDTTPWPDMLRAATDDTVTVINEGHSGQTTQFLTDRVQEADFLEYAAGDYTRKIAFVWECRNDMVVNGITPTQAVDNLETLCNTLVGFDEIWVGTTTADESGDANFTPTDHDDVNDLIRDRFADFADGLIDLGADARLSDGDNTTYFSGDKIHFVNGGCQVVADLVAAQLVPDNAATSSQFDSSDAAAGHFALWGDDRVASKTTPAGWTSLLATEGKTTGKLYFELRCTHNEVSAAGSFMVGLADATFNPAGGYLGSSGMSVGFSGGGSTFASAFTSGGTHTAFDWNAQGGAATLGLVAQVIVDLDVGKVWTGTNGTINGDPVSGTGAAATFTPGTELFPGLTQYDNNSSDWALQTTGGRLSYEPPSGFLPWDGGELDTTVRWDQGQADARGFTLSSDGLTLGKMTTGWSAVRATTAKLTGKHAFEVECVGAGVQPYFKIGLCNYGFDGVAQYVGQNGLSIGMANGDAAVSGFTGSANPVAELPNLGDRYQVQVDMDAGKLWVTDEAGASSGDPAAGTGALYTFTPGTALFPAMSLFDDDCGSWKLWAAAADLVYPLPTGFNAWEE